MLEERLVHFRPRTVLVVLGIILAAVVMIEIVKAAQGILIWIAVLRHEAPYTLLAATLTPVGPVGSVIAIEYLERRRGFGSQA